MKTNLIYFSNCLQSQKLDILDSLPGFVYGSFSKIWAKTELNAYCDVEDIKNALTNSSVIALDFSDDELFSKVQTAVSQKYHAAVKNTAFGGFCKSGANQFCCVINIGKKPKFDIDELQSLYQNSDVLCLKLWGISESELVKLCNSADSFNFKSYTIYEHFGDIYLVVKDEGDEVFRQECYQLLSNYIYFEEFNTPLGSIAEIESVRKSLFGIMDFTGQVFDMFYDEMLKPFVTNLANCGVNKNTTIDQIKKLVFSRGLSFALVIAPTKEGTKVIFIDDDIHPFTIENKEDKLGQTEYLKNFICIKIFNKLRKNTFLY